MWILVWLSLEGQAITHYHLGTFNDKDKCTKALSEAVVLVTANSQSVKCLDVSTTTD